MEGHSQVIAIKICAVEHLLLTMNRLGQRTSAQSYKRVHTISNALFIQSYDERDDKVGAGVADPGVNKSS